VTSPVQVEIDETAITLYVLPTHVAMEIAFAAAGFAENGHVTHPFAVREGYATACNALVGYSISQNQASALESCSAPPSGEAVPNRCDELFKEANHGLIIWGGFSGLVTQLSEDRRRCDPLEAECRQSQRELCEVRVYSCTHENSGVGSFATPEIKSEAEFWKERSGTSWPSA